MTVNEIIKALQCCEEGLCKGCPFSSDSACMYRCRQEVIKLIKRQQAELNKMQAILDDVLDRQPILVEISEKYARAEAIKEFADRLNAEMFYKCGDMNYTETCEARRLINDLVKEMTEEEK